MKEIKSLNYLKGIMALSIVIFHYNKFTLTNHNDINFPFFNILKSIYIDGGLLVELFFLISGFCLFMFYSERIKNNKLGIKDFLKKRILKLYPLYIITTIVILLLQFLFLKKYGYYFDSGISLTIKDFLLNIVCLGRGWFSNDLYPYNAPAWFLSVLIFDYLLFYLVNKFIKSDKLRFLVISGLIMLGVILKYNNFQYPVFNVEMGRGLTNFFLGGFVSILYTKINSNIKIQNKVIIILLIIILLPIVFEFKSYYFLVFCIFPSVLLLFLLSDKYLIKLNFLNMLGKISFSIYLWHYCYMCFIKILPVRFDYYSTQFFVIYLVTSIGLSWVSYIFIEKKLSNFIQNKIS